MFGYLHYSLAAATLTAGGTGSTADLRVEVTNARQDAPVYLALFDDAASFKRRDGFRLAVIKRWATRPSAAFTDLPPGRYAVAAFQDLNGNGVLDTNLLGIPTEPYGFSRNAIGNLGPPSFEAAAIAMDGQDLTISIALRNSP